MARIQPKWIRLGVVAAVLVVGGLTWNRWWPHVDQWVRTTLARQRPANAEEEGEHDHEGEEGHAHAGHSHAHDEASSLELSLQARRNLGLTDDNILPIALQTYRKSITVPAVVVVRPGRTQIQVSTPMTGVVTHVHAVAGEAVQGGLLLFRVRLTHEDLVQAQTDFVKALGEQDVEKREIARLKDVAGGAVAGKTLLERQYANDKLEAVINAQREALRLHGLSDRQVEQIAKDRRLLRELDIAAPTPDVHDDQEELRLSGRKIKPVRFQQSKQNSETQQQGQPFLVIDELDVQKGQSVESGARLCVLSDYSRLYIEGRAFEQDVPGIGEALKRNWTATAAFSDGLVIDKLPLAYVANQIDPEARTLRFFVDLPNQVTRDTVNGEGQRFITWQFRPGQRLQLEVPIEEWADQIVLPVESVAEEGAETYVFLQNGDHFDRVPVHVTYRDQRHAVIANDGSVFPGDKVAMRSAHQLLLALKNKSGGGVDPHAGHNH